MLKIRILAVVIAIILTLATIYVVPIILYHYSNFMAGLTENHRYWFMWVQVGAGAIVAIFGFWNWRRSKNNKS